MIVGTQPIGMPVRRIYTLFARNRISRVWAERRDQIETGRFIPAHLLASIARLRSTGKLILKPVRDGAQ
jgi:hypothetical protein